MNFSTKIVLAAVGLGLVAGLYYYDTKTTEHEQAQTQLASKAFNFEPVDVRTFEVNNPQGRFVFQRPSATENWEMTEPRPVRLDQDSVNNLLSSLQSLTITQELADADVSTDEARERFGLKEPRIRIKLDTEGGQTNEFLIGADLSLGSQSGERMNAISTYALNPARQGVLVVSSSIANTANKGFSDFRTREVADFDPANVEKIVVRRKGEPAIELGKSDNRWNVLSPRELAADDNNVSLFLNTLDRLRVEEVVEQADLNDEKLQSMNLIEPNSVVELLDKDGQNLNVFPLGLTSQFIYTRMSDGAVGAFDISRWTEVSPDLKFFRDRRVMRDVDLEEVAAIQTNSGRTFQKEGNSWYLVESAAGNSASGDGSAGAAPAVAERTADVEASRFFSDWEFMVADDIIDGPEAQDLSKYGLDKPLTKFSFVFPESEKGQMEILVGDRVPKNEKSVYVKRSDKSDVYVVETAWLDSLTEMDGGGGSQQP